MNELERAAADLVANPAVAPTPVADLEARAGAVRRRQRAIRFVGAAAALIVLALGVTAVVRHRPNEQSLDVGGPPGSSTSSITFEVGSSRSSTESSTEAAANREIIAKRLTTFGARDVSVVDQPAVPNGSTVHASGIDLATARLLIETPGVLAQVGVSEKIGGDCTPGSGVFTAVGWPIAKPSCLQHGPEQMLNSGGGAPVTRADVVPDGKAWSVHVVFGGGFRTSAGCRERYPVVCDGVTLDAELLADPTAIYRGEQVQLQWTDDGFRYGGLSDRDAGAFAATVQYPSTFAFVLLDTGLVVGRAALPSTVPSVPPPGTQDSPAVLVYVAAAPIPRGTSGDDAVRRQLIVERSVPARFAPPSAIMEPAIVAGQVALFDIALDAVIVDGMFVAPGTPALGSATTPPTTAAG